MLINEKALQIFDIINANYFNGRNILQLVFGCIAYSVVA